MGMLRYTGRVPLLIAVQCIALLTISGSCFGSGAGKPVLTITAVSDVVVKGDAMPPLIWAATGWVDGDTVYSASTGGPVLTTTASAASAPGSYPITIAGGSFAAEKYEVRYQPGVLQVLPTSAVGARTRRFSFPSDAMVNVESYGAVHDGKKDDSAALLAALTEKRGLAEGATKCGDFANVGRTLYFPPGVYRITQPLTWQCGAETALRGAGPMQTILRLDDRLAAFNGSTNVAAVRLPSATTARGYGNIAFRNFLSGMTIDLGVGNAKAYGVDFTASNEGSVRDVRVISESSDAAAGLYLAVTYPGPELIKDVAIYGGVYGIQAGQQGLYSETYSHLTLAGQKSAGIYSPNILVAAEQVLSCNRSAAVQNGGQPMAVIDAVFACGSAESPAIKTQAPSYFRNITVQGYTTSLINVPQKISLAGNIAEWFTPGATAAAFPDKATSLNLPVKETPDIADPEGSTWCKLSSTDPSQWSAQLAACPVHTAYTSAGESASTAGTYDINIPSTIDHIRFFTSNRSPFGHVILNLNVEGGTRPLLIEDIAGVVNVFHRSPRTLILADYAGSYTAVPGAGALFGEDVGIGQGGLKTPTTTFYPGQQVYIRQLNIELQNNFAPGKDYKNRNSQCDGKTVFVGACLPPTGVKLLANGAQVWLLGYKTEESTTEMMLRNQARVEIFGMYMLPNNYNVQPDNRAFDIQDSSLSLAGVEEYIYAGAVSQNTGHPHLLQEGRGSTVRSVDMNQNRPQQFSLAYGFGQTKTPATSSVTLTANTAGGNSRVAPGSEFQVSVREAGGATGLINWSVLSTSGGAKVTLYDLNASRDHARVVVGDKAGPCQGIANAASAKSAVGFVLQAQSVDDPAKTVSFPFVVCQGDTSDHSAPGRE